MKQTRKLTLVCKCLFIGSLVTVLTAGCKKDADAVSENSPIFQDETDGQIAAAAPTSVPTGSYDLTASLPAKYVKDGSVDYTVYLQAAITKYNNVTLPAFPIMINEKGLVIPSNRILNFLSTSKLIAKPTALANYNVIRIERASNVTINNPVIVGDVGKHLGTSGEWGMGISIISCSNITINDGSITKCWGDGIYLSTTTSGAATNTNIKITNTILQYNRRDGISITSVNGLVLESIVAGNSTGTSPMCGINFEPEIHTDELQNISILNCKTEYNGGYGIQFSLSNLYGGANKNLSITLQNHYDKKSQIGLKASAYIAKRKANETITGTLRINSPYWRQNPVSPIFTGLLEDNLKLLISKPVVQDVSGRTLSQAETYNLLTYKRNINTAAKYTITF